MARLLTKKCRKTRFFAFSCERRVFSQSRQTKVAYIFILSRKICVLPRSETLNFGQNIMQIYANELKLSRILSRGPRGLRTEVWSDSENFQFAVPPPFDPYGELVTMRTMR